MPAIAALVVKKADETTNITFDPLTGAAGDGSKAVWRQDTGAVAAMPVGHRAVLSMATVWNGPKTARRSVIEFKRPYSTQNSTTLKYESTDSVVGRLEITVPQAIPATEINEAVYQFCNLIGLASGQIKVASATGYAPQ